jgi:hypothetical protein
MLGLVLGLLAVAAAIAVLTSSHGSSAQPAHVPLATARSTQVQATPAAPTHAALIHVRGTQVATTPAVPTQAATTQVVPTAAVPAQAVPTQTMPAQAAPPQVVPTQAAPTEPPQPAQPALSGQTLTTSAFSVTVPPSWQVAGNQASQTAVEVTLEEPSHGYVDIFAETSATAQQLLQQALSVKQQAYPDARVCGNSGQDTVGGVTGPTELICFTMTPQGGAAQNVQDGVWAGASADGTTGYAVQIIGLASDQQFFNDAASVAETLQWIGGQ